MVQQLVVRSRQIHRPRFLGIASGVMLALAIASALTTVGLLILTIRGERALVVAQESLLANRNSIRNLQTRVAEIESSKRHAPPTPESIRTSLTRFETRVLRTMDETQSAVILEVNRLATSSSVSLAEVAFNPIEQKGETGAQSGRGGGMGVFPGMEMNFTVQGTYRDVRAFLAGLETTKAFVVINNVDLKSVEDAKGQAGSDSGSTDRVIALGVNLSVYYARAVHG